jgi:hypothetical protein
MDAVAEASPVPGLENAVKHDESTFYGNDEEGKTTYKSFK